MYEEEQDFQPQRRSEIFFWIFAVTALFMFLGHDALQGSESRWGEVVREMMTTGDYLHPAINWRIYFDKPQLSYWLIVPFALLLGLGELALRIPSALAALAALYAVMALGKRLFDRRTALTAGWILLSCLGFAQWSRTAAADMANCAAIVIAVAWFYRVEVKAGFVGYLVFFLIVFVGALAKGLPAVAVPLVMILPHLLAGKRWKKHLNCASIAAALIAVLVFLMPFAAAALVEGAENLRLPVSGMSPLELVWQENIVRAFAAFDHKDPFYSYLYNLPRIMLPWAPLLAVAVAGLIAGWKQLKPELRELIVGALLVFVMFSCSGSRRWYYILPLAPFVSLIGAASLAGFGARERWNGIAVDLMRYAALIAGALGFAVLVTLPLWERLLGVSAPLLFAVALPAAGVLTLLAVMIDTRPENRVVDLVGLPHRQASMVLGWALMTASFVSCALPSLTSFRTEKPFLVDLRGHLAGIPGRQFCFIGTGYNTDALFYLAPQEPTVAVGRNPEKVGRLLREFLDANGGHRVVLLAKTKPGRFNDELRKCFPNGEIDPEKPDFSETPSIFADSGSRLWRVWLVDLLEENKNNVTREVKNDER